MGIFSSIFGRKPDEALDKGEKCMASGNFYEARCYFEEGLSASQKKPEFSQLVDTFNVKILEANHSLALLNLEEARHALAEGKQDKAHEHIELAKTLTSDSVVREKADSMLAIFDEKINNTRVLETKSSCSSCSSSTPHDVAEADNSSPDGSNLDAGIHYELLINQLPGEMFPRYSGLGEEFACMYIAASRDEHKLALELLEAWHVTGHDEDIYWNEKGKILHRLGSVDESEKCFQKAISVNPDFHLPYLGRALLLIEESRFNEAGGFLDQMIAGNIFTGQAVMMRGEVFQITGDLDSAIDTFASLLKSPLKKAAAEKIHEILQCQNRHAEAAAVHKQYLKSCCH